MKFADLGLIPELLEAVTKAGYTEPTPIQQKAIAPTLEGRDLIGCAQTGTGKTAAFSLPTLQRIDASAGDEPALRALVLTPTRELAAQIGESFKTYGAGLDLFHTVIFGGVNEKPQIRELRQGVDILVATPGRLLDLLGRRLLSLDAIELFILDEADRMLDMGFINDVRKVLALLPKKRQTLLFSATMPEEIRQLASKMMVDPVEVTVTPVSSTAEKINQQVYFTDKASKRKLLLEVLSSPDVKRTLVFSRTKHGANRVVKYLDQGGIPAAAIHGNKSQGARTRALDGFRSGELPVLVATDIAARGIDVEGVTHVVNFDLPNIPETYVHRIGRTARAGAEGKALSFCEHEERPFLADIERLIKQNIERVTDHPFPPTEPLPRETDLNARAGRSGGAAPKRGGNSGGGRGNRRGGQGGRPGGRDGAADTSRRRPAGGGKRRGGGGGPARRSHAPT